MNARFYIIFFINIAYTDYLLKQYLGYFGLKYITTNNFTHFLFTFLMWLLGNGGSVLGSHCVAMAWCCSSGWHPKVWVLVTLSYCLSCLLIRCQQVKFSAAGVLSACKTLHSVPQRHRAPCTLQGFPASCADKAAVQVTVAQGSGVSRWGAK